MTKRKSAPKPQQSVQLSAVTRKQMRELARLWGMPETRHTTAVIRRAVEIAWRKEIAEILADARTGATQEPA